MIKTKAAVNPNSADTVWKADSLGHEEGSEGGNKEKLIEGLQAIRDCWSPEQKMGGRDKATEAPSRRPLQSKWRNLDFVPNTVGTHGNVQSMGVTFRLAFRKITPAGWLQKRQGDQWGAAVVIQVKGDVTFSQVADRGTERSKSTGKTWGRRN